LSFSLMAVAAIAAGCGDAPSPAPRSPVQLTLSSPADGATTREAAVRISGRVSPVTARVIVLGEQVSADDGVFSATVDLREGANVVDVGASAPGMRATWRALRVTRRSKVELPALVGQEADPARTTLEDLGLKVRIVNYDDLFDAFRRRPRLVCSTNPPAGAQVDAGARVTVVVSKTC
jgi:hypothetical protein